MPTVISSQKAAFRPELLTQQASREALSPLQNNPDFGSQFSKAAHFKLGNATTQTKFVSTSKDNYMGKQVVRVHAS